jgi:hypothetical protein
MSPYFSLNSISNSMVNRISRKGVLAIAFLCLVTYLLAFPGEADALNLELFIGGPPGANEVLIEYPGFSQKYNLSATVPVPDGETVTATALPGPGLFRYHQSHYLYSYWLAIS